MYLDSENTIPSPFFTMQFFLSSQKTTIPKHKMVCFSFAEKQYSFLLLSLKTISICICKDRSSHKRGVQKDILGNVTKFTGKHLRQSSGKGIYLDAYSTLHG